MIATRQHADITLAPDEAGALMAYVTKGFPDKKVVYKIGKEPVRKVVTFPYHDFILLRTDGADFLRDASNQPISGESSWSDFYFEPFTNTLYRCDERNYWYDLEGFRLASPVFLKGDVLISLPGKTSKQSWAFSDQDLVSSPHAQLIQVGKLVFDQQLNIVRYFGEKITGLGRKHISFGGTDQWQEVCRGISARAFVNEFTGVPLLINDEEIVGHVAGVTRGARHFEVFRSSTREYVLENSSEGEIRYDGIPLGIDLETYVTLNGAEIVLASDGRRNFYFDLGSRAPFHIAETGKELIAEISTDPVELEDTTLYNVRTAHRSFVYDQAQKSVFKVGDTEPDAVANVPDFSEHYFFATINGKQRLCTKHNQAVIELGADEFQVAKITGRKGGKLLNALTISGERIVMDVREGLRSPRLALVDKKRIVRIVGPSYRIGDMVLQHVELDSLGGSSSRVINLEEKVLTAFSLPADLTVYPDQPQVSCFAGNPIVNIDFNQVITVQGEEFLQATFLSDMGDERNVMLQHGNARPLHLDGLGHRNELVTSFKERSAQKAYKIGEHVMIGAFTLNEELVEGDLMVSINRNRSWLPFYDTFLPVFRRAVHVPEIKAWDGWDCILFELLSPAGTPGEYVAVEKNKPNRLLARRSKGKIEPKIITSKTRVLSDPEEMSALAKFFLSPGMLVEVA